MKSSFSFSRGPILDFCIFSKTIINLKYRLSKISTMNIGNEFHHPSPQHRTPTPPTGFLSTYANAYSTFYINFVLYCLGGENVD